MAQNKRKRISPYDTKAVIEGMKEYEKIFPRDKLTKEERREIRQIHKELYPGRIRKFLMRRRIDKMKFGSARGGLSNA